MSLKCLCPFSVTRISSVVIINFYIWNSFLSVWRHNIEDLLEMYGSIITLLELWLGTSQEILPSGIEILHFIFQNLRVFQSHLTILELDMHCVVLTCSLLTSFHCVKSVLIRSFFWSLFSQICTEYGKIRTRKNSLFGNFKYFKLRRYLYQIPIEGKFQVVGQILYQFLFFVFNKIFKDFDKTLSAM